jgi:1,4-alpha-glucan branching enzyme
MTLKILEIDPYLEPYKADLDLRVSEVARTKSRILADGKSLSDFASGADYFGFHEGDGYWTFREWAPNAERAWLVGDFNGWDGLGFEMERLPKTNGIWELRADGKLPAGSKVKVQLYTKQGEDLYRVPSYALYAVQNPEYHFDGVIYKPSYEFKNAAPEKPGAPLIYEAHIGISSEDYKINSYNEFREQVLPRVKADGYNTIQLMAIQEHPLYASFGYQVSNFFAASSRFGTPDELMALIDAAHGLGIRVLLDVVHSHAVKNTGDGLNLFDGTTAQYFHEGDKGEHREWNTKLFNYGKDEVLHFLLSNLKFWLTTYHFDGFRFDGVTSMLYHDHGLGTAFTDYSKYFSLNTDLEAVTYLTLANELVHEVKPDATTIAEDMSAMPGMALPVSYGGAGFDYRLSMGIPDYWIKQFKTKSDWELNLQELWWELTTRRPGEKNIGYAESHDQALVGDKTIFMWLANEGVYYEMAANQESAKIDRALALHKLVRLVTFSLAGEGYLNFMGNEFGHPEWLDFPREGNGDSFQHARRQWSLSEREDLKYHFLGEFDRAMTALEADGFMERPTSLVQRWIQDEDKLLAYKKGDLLFVFNFNPEFKKELAFPVAGKPELIFDTDDTRFGGFGPRNNFSYDGENLEMALEPRTAFVFQID